MPGTTASTRHSPLARVAAAVLLFVYMGGIFALSHRSRVDLPKPLAHVSDSALHVAAYAPLGFLLAVASGPSHALGAWVATAGAGFFAATDEFHQSLVPGREGSVGDFAQDTLGGAAGAWLAFLWRRGRRWRAAHRGHAVGDHGG